MLPLQTVLDSGIVGIVRSSDPTHLVEVIGALAEGGVRVVEVTFTVPDAIEVLKATRRAFGDKIVLGAGTVLDPETCRAAILAGAEFIVSPTINLEVIAMCKRYTKLSMPGAFTPTEILTAWQAGADIVKVFPSEVLGPKFFEAMRRPLPQIRLMPTGGVDLDTIGDYIKAGACCLGAGSSLVDPKAMSERNFAKLTSLAKDFVTALRTARGK